MKIKNATLEALVAEMVRRIEGAARKGDMRAMADTLDCIENLAFYGIVVLGGDEESSLEGVVILNEHLEGKVTYFIHRQDINVH